MKQATPSNVETVDAAKANSQVGGMLDPTPIAADPCTLFNFDEFLRGRSLTRTTGYRYRQQGLLQTVNIYGRLYITLEEIRRFERRAIAGEFSKSVKTPSRRELVPA